MLFCFMQKSALRKCVVGKRIVSVNIYRNSIAGYLTTMEKIKEIWKNSDAVCFDVDSTVCTTEMIDELAAFCNVGPQVSALTKKAMEEGMSYREALDARLKIIKPSKKIIEDFEAAHPAVLTDGVDHLIGKLIEMNKAVYLVSGGFQSIIVPLALQLGISQSNVFSNKILFNADGNYAGFDTNEPTSSTGGKKVVVEKLKADHGYKTLTMIGDGMTDFEAYPPADLFIGFGGNVVRENVRSKSPWYVTNFKELIDSLSC